MSAASTDASEHPESHEKALGNSIVPQVARLWMEAIACVSSQE